MNTEHPLYGFIRSAIQIATEYRDGSIDHGEMIASMEAALAAPPAALAHPSRGVVDEASLYGAIARGWCSPENAHKVMDAELVTAIAREVQAVQAAALPAANVAGLREGNWHHPEGGRIVGWVIEPTDMERMKADAFCLPHEVAEALAALRDRAALPAVPEGITADEVQWVVNDIAELGVMIRGQCFFLYKGNSLVYEDARHDDGRPMQIRTVGKREFGECCHPVVADISACGYPHKWGTVSLDDSDRWQPLLAAAPAQEGE